MQISCYLNIKAIPKHAQWFILNFKVPCGYEPMTEYITTS